MTCPSNITQTNDFIVNFLATATDNSGVVPTISYSSAPGSKFMVGETVVTVTAIDGAENKA